MACKPVTLEPKVVKATIAPPAYLKEGKYGPPPVDRSHQLYAIVLACLDVPPQSDGERSGTRQGFLWSVPRHTPQHFDLWPYLESTLKQYGKLVKVSAKQIHWLAVDLDAGKPLGISMYFWICTMYAAVDATLPGSLSSNSFRRVAPTWASLAKLSEDQKLALGNWTKRSASVATTPETEFGGGNSVLWFFNTLAGSEPAGGQGDL